jgi:TusA-related sulfurtransferase
MVIDARGYGCPEPVLMTKKGLAKNPEGLEVLVDNNTAKENIKRFAGNQGYSVDVEKQNNDFLLKITK